MKKKLLSLTFAAFSFGALAQTTSFEASQGFTVGPADDQAGWNISTLSPGSGAIVNTEATDGTQSLAIIGTGLHTVPVNWGAFSPITVFNDDVVTMKFDVKFSEFSNDASDFFFGTQSPSQQFSTARIRFTFQGNIQYLGYTSGTTLGYVTVPFVSLVAQQWYHVDIVHFFVDAEPRVEYYLDGELIGTAPIYGGTNVEQVTLLNDDFESTAFVDDLVVGAGNLAVNKSAKAQFALYPNPARDVLNIATEAVLESVSITDINGRVVKNVTLNADNNAQVNIADLASGVYMVDIRSDKGSEVKKIVKN